jgi:predicted metal-dependent HD superfamily phosphohydrolase
MASTEKQKAYAKEHYQKNKDKYLARAAAMRAWADDLKHDIPCNECGKIFHPVVMDWHHRDPETKVAAVAWLVRNAGRQAVLDEIAKCDLVCANCHRLLTHDLI